MTTLGQTVGQRVRLARTARGRGVNELDRLIGSKQGYVSRLESSDREPRADTLRKLAQALNVSLEWLATGEGTMDGATTPDHAPPPTLATVPPPPNATPSPGSVVVYDDDDPYPNRSRAIALLGHNLDPRARAVLLSYRFRSGGGRDEDLPLDLWLDEAKNLQRQVRRLDREFAAIEREGQRPTGEGAEASSGWTPIPPVPTPNHEAMPERLHHARVRHRKATPSPPVAVARSPRGVRASKKRLGRCAPRARTH